MKSVKLCAVLLLGLATPWVAPVQASPAIAVSCPGITLTSPIMGINDSGEMISNAWPTGILIGADGSCTPISFPDASLTIALGINNKGWIVGDYQLSSGNMCAFLLRDGEYSQIPVSGENIGDVDAFGINDAGQVVGSYWYASNVDNIFENGYLYTPGAGVVDITDPEIVQMGNFSVCGSSPALIQPTGINNAGQIVGYYQVTTCGSLNAFVEQGGIWRTVNPLGALPSGSGASTGAEFYGINNNQQILGEIWAGQDEVGYQFVLDLRTMALNDIASPDGDSFALYGINDLGQLLGNECIGSECNSNENFVLPANGVDISFYSDCLTEENWDSMKSAGIQFAVVEAEGNVTFNDDAACQLLGAQREGLLTGAYLYLNFNSSGDSQVELSREAIGEAWSQLKFLSVDVEVPTGKVFSQSPPAVADRISIILEAVEAIRDAGKAPIIYTSREFWNTITGDSHNFADLSLWDSDATARPLYNLSSFLPYGGWNARQGRQYAIQQYMFDVPFGVDLDVFNPTLFGVIPATPPSMEP